MIDNQEINETKNFNKLKIMEYTIQFGYISALIEDKSTYEQIISLLNKFTKKLIGLDEFISEIKNMKNILRISIDNKIDELYRKKQYLEDLFKKIKEAK